MNAPPNGLHHDAFDALFPTLKENAPECRTRFAPPSPNGANGQPTIRDLQAEPPSLDGGHDNPAMSDNGAEDQRKGRDKNGRFTKGNPGGPGNPFGRYMAAVRLAACEAVTCEEIRALMRQFLLQAQHGDVAAGKVLLTYVVGRAVDPVDPDTLDIQERQLFNQVPTPKQDVHRILNSLPAGLACELIRILLPNTELQIKSLWWKKMQGDMKKEELQEKRKAARKSAPPSAEQVS